MSDDDRLLSAFRALLRAELARITFAACWEYAVTRSRRLNGVVVFDGQPTAKPDDVLMPLPPAVAWPIRPGVAGADFLPAAGSVVLVAFANMDPTKPRVVAFDAAAPVGTVVDSTGAMKVGASASGLELVGGVHETLSPGAEAGRAVCYGDTVQMFLGTAMVPTPIKLMRAGTLVSLAGNPAAPVSKVTA